MKTQKKKHKYHGYHNTLIYVGKTISKEKPHTPKSAQYII
jgi:hypothetical protein